MVQRIYVKCPSCGKIYQLKFQIDQNIKIYEWPISFECVDCGLINLGRMVFSQRNLRTYPRHKTHQ